MLMLRLEESEYKAEVRSLETQWFIKACKSWIKGAPPHEAYLEDHGHEYDFYGNRLDGRIN